MSESTCFLTGKEPPERLYFVLSVGCVIAEYLGNTGRERSALSLRHECAKLLKFLPPGDDTEALKCTTYLAISLLCDSVDDLKGAIKYRKTSIAIQETIRDTFPDLCTWETHRILGSLYVRYGNYEKGFESLEQALVLAEDSNDKAGICHNLSQLHIALGNHEKAAEYLGKDIGKSRVTKCTEFDNLFTKGMQFQSSGKLRNAIGCFERALTISQQMKDKEAEGVICSRLGDVHLDMKNLKEALMYYELSLGLAKEVGYKDVQHVLCCQIAMLTISVDSGKAFEHLQMGLALSEELQDLHSKLLSLGIEGFISLMGGDYKQAIAAYEEALKHYEEMEALTKIKGDLKIYLGDKLYHVYSMLSRALLYDDQKIKALVVADRGRARALAALMSSKYGIPASSRYHKMLSTTDVLQMPGKGSRLLIASIIEPMVCVWFLAPQGGMKWHITVPIREGKVSNYITSVVDESYHQMIVPQPDAKCEDRSLPGLYRNQDESNPEQPHSVPGSSADLLWEKLQKKLPMPDIFSRNTKPWNAQGPPLTILHDLMVPPVLAELLRETKQKSWCLPLMAHCALPHLQLSKTPVAGV